MRESLKHQQAFDYYYALGETRSLPQVVQKFRVSLTTVKRWSKEFNWQRRIQERDTKVSRRLEQSTETAMVNAKRKYKVDVTNMMQLIQAVALTVLLTDEEGRPIKDAEGRPRLRPELKAQNPSDLAVLANAADKLIRLDMYLMGGADSRVEVNLTAQQAIVKYEITLADFLKLHRIEKDEERQKQLADEADIVDLDEAEVVELPEP